MAKYDAFSYKFLWFSTIQSHFLVAKPPQVAFGLALLGCSTPKDINSQKGFDPMAHKPISYEDRINNKATCLLQSPTMGNRWKLLLEEFSYYV